MKDMSEMMQKCMAMMHEQGGMDMCSPDTMEEMMKKMQQKNKHTEEIAKYATPELRDLFEDWLVQLEEEVVSFVNTSNSTSPDIVARKFKLSNKSAEFILNKMAEKGKINNV